MARKTREANFPEAFLGLLKDLDLDGSFGKTSPEFCPQMEDGILVPSSGRWQNSGMGPATGFWTVGIFESHNDAEESTLSAVLETGEVPQKYYLSPVICMGMLRRNESRQKILPDALRKALEEVMTSKPKPS